MNKDLLFNSEEIFTIHHSLFIIHSKRGCSSAGRAVPLQGIGQGFESPHLHQKRGHGSEKIRTFEGFWSWPEGRRQKGSKGPKENVDNRIQYVGQIAREGKLSKKKPKSRIFIRKNKNTEWWRQSKWKGSGERKTWSMILEAWSKKKNESERRRTCSLHHVKSY